MIFTCFYFVPKIYYTSNQSTVIFKLKVWIKPKKTLYSNKRMTSHLCDLIFIKVIKIWQVRVVRVSPVKNGWSIYLICSHKNHMLNYWCIIFVRMENTSFNTYIWTMISIQWVVCFYWYKTHKLNKILYQIKYHWRFLLSYFNFFFIYRFLYVYSFMIKPFRCKGFHSIL